MCAACYAFATKLCLENTYCLTTNNKPIVLSAQQFVDCSHRPEEPDMSNLGCQGGHHEECVMYLNVSFVFFLYCYI